MLFYRVWKDFFKLIFFTTIMRESLNLEEENIIKDIRNLFRLKKELNYTVIEYIINLFRTEKETKAIKENA